MNHRVLGALALIPVAAGASANEITETLEGPVRAVLESKQTPADLEFCVADAITQIGGAVPVPVRNGPQNMLMLGYGNTPKIVISLDVMQGGTRLTVRTRSGDMDDKLVKGLLESCKDLAVVST